MVPRRRSTLYFILSLSFLPTLSNCAANTEAPVERVGFVSTPIQGGYVDQTDSAVVGVIHFGGGGFGACSGTLIAPNVVLTARHCVAPITGNGSVICGQTKFGNTYPANQMYVTTLTSFTQNPADYHRASEVILPPGSADVCGRDQAIIILENPIAAEEAVPLVPRVDVPLEKGEGYYAVGYGATYDGQGAPSGTRYRRDDLSTQCIGNGCPFMVESTEWRGETGVCQGDSGGPAIDLVNRVTGVASRGTSGCEMPVYGYVYAWADWIKETTMYAASISGVEPPPWATGAPTDPVYSAPVGDNCELPEQCDTNACLDQYCTRPCLDNAPCPDGYFCAEHGYCEQNEEPAAAISDDAESETISSCSLSRSPDPTNPIPWVIGTTFLCALIASRRRRSSFELE